MEPSACMRRRLPSHRCPSLRFLIWQLMIPFAWLMDVTELNDPFSYMGTLLLTVTAHRSIMETKLMCMHACAGHVISPSRRTGRSWRPSYRSCSDSPAATQNSSRRSDSSSCRRAAARDLAHVAWGLSRARDLTGGESPLHRLRSAAGHSRHVTSQPSRDVTNGRTVGSLFLQALLLLAFLNTVVVVLTTLPP